MANDFAVRVAVVGLVVVFIGWGLGGLELFDAPRLVSPIRSICYLDHSQLDFLQNGVIGAFRLRAQRCRVFAKQSQRRASSAVISQTFHEKVGKQQVGRSVTASQPLRDAERSESEPGPSNYHLRGPVVLPKQCVLVPQHTPWRRPGPIKFLNKPLTPINSHVIP